MSIKKHNVQDTSKCVSLEPDSVDYYRRVNVSTEMSREAIFFSLIMLKLNSWILEFRVR